MPFDDFTADTSSQQKQTHVTFTNTEHPDTSADYAEEDDMQAHFEAANAIQDSRLDRKLVVGELLVALEECLEEDTTDPLADYLDQFEE